VAEKLRLETEAVEKQTHREMEERQKDKDRETERLRLELEERTKQHEFELRMREIETSANSQRVHYNGKTGGGDSSARPQVASMKALKLPPYNKDKDDLDAYLSRFERVCHALNVQPEHWSAQLARLLEGQALDVYQRMSDNHVGSYETLKENLLKRFRLTEGGYRKRFKQSNIENGETPEQFIDRLRRYLQKWCHMAGFEQTYEGLEDLVVRDQFFITCDKPLQTFLKGGR